MKRVVVLGLFILGVVFLKNKNEEQKKAQQNAIVADILKDKLPSGKTHFSEGDFIGKVTAVRS